MRVLALACFLLLASCGNPLSLLTGGGPNVAANVQAGATNSQTIGQTNNINQELVRPQARTINQSADTSKVKTELVESLTINEGMPASFWIALGAWSWFLWRLPSPDVVGQRIRNWFRWR